jgi:hypothetical protein
VYQHKGEISSRDEHLFGTPLEDLLKRRLGKDQIFGKSQTLSRGFKSMGRERSKINKLLLSTNTPSYDTNQVIAMTRNRDIQKIIHPINTHPPILKLT